MIDYWLGGSNHYSLDVEAAHAFEGAYGPCAAIFRSLRAFSGRAARYLVGCGVDRFLVFGAGIPSQGNVHESAPGARVLYIDLDPEIVAVGSALVESTPGVTYVLGDAADPRNVGADTLDDALPGWRDRPVGVIFLGLAAFLDDATLARALDELFDLVSVRSRLAFDFDGMELAAYPQALAMMGPNFHMREPADFGALLGRWKVTDDGIVPVMRWRPEGLEEQVPDAFWGGLAIK